MELRDLEYFEVIAELEHVGRAAKRLHRSQPTLTNCLRRLEKMSGGPLVQRHGRGIRLTEAGKLLRAFAVKTRLDVQGARARLQAATSGLSGEVRVGLVPSAAQFLMPEIVGAAFREMPDVLIRSEVATFAALDAMLRNGDLDFIVVNETHPRAGIVSEPLMSDVIVPAAPAGHPIFAIRRPAIADLGRHGWILQPASFPHRQWIEGVFRKAGVAPPRVQIETNMLNLQPQLVATSGLLTVLPRLQLERDGLKEVRVAGVELRRRLELRVRNDAYVSPAAARLAELLKRARPKRTARPVEARPVRTRP